MPLQNAWHLVCVQMLEKLESDAAPLVPHEAIELPLTVAKELFKRSVESGFGDNYQGYISELLRYAMRQPPAPITSIPFNPGEIERLADEAIAETAAEVARRNRSPKGSGATAGQ